jgi:hypothetical protein
MQLTLLHVAGLTALPDWCGHVLFFLGTIVEPVHYTLASLLLIVWVDVGRPGGLWSGIELIGGDFLRSGCGANEGVIGLIFGVVLDNLRVEVERGGLAEWRVVPQRTSNTHKINIIGSDRLLIKMREWR